MNIKHYFKMINNYLNDKTTYKKKLARTVMPKWWKEEQKLLRNTKVIEQEKETEYHINFSYNTNILYSLFKNHKAKLIQNRIKEQQILNHKFKIKTNRSWNKM